MEGFAYINIEPNNGGSVLDVSEGGLCFHSIAPVPRDRAIHFWFSEQDRRIEGVGELAWMDESQKTGGVRFTSLSAEAREHIHRWTSLPAVPLAADKQPRVFSALGSRPDKKSAVFGGPGPMAIVSPMPRESMPLSAFSRGLLTGLLVAVVVAAGFSVHAYRQEIGEWLIQVGQRFAAKPQPQTPALQPAVLSAQQTAPSPQPSGSSVQQSQPPAQHTLPQAPGAVSPAPTPQPERPLPQPAATPAKPVQENPAPAKLVTAVVVPANAPKPPASSDAPEVSAAPPTLPSTTPPLSSDLISGKSATLPQLAAATPPPATNPPAAANHPADRVEVAREESAKASVGPPPEMYFEVGRSKDSLEAHQISDKLEQLGFHSSISQKSRLWSNSYLVLVGPYADEDAAAEAGKTLLAHDFRPRPFERGNRDITLRSGLTLNGERIPGGDCTIHWETYITGTVVKVLQDHLLVTTANGRWEKNDSKYRRDAFVYRRNLDGSKTLLEIQFAGLSRSLVFGKTS